METKTSVVELEQGHSDRNICDICERPRYEKPGIWDWFIGVNGNDTDTIEKVLNDHLFSLGDFEQVIMGDSKYSKGILCIPCRCEHCDKPNIDMVVESIQEALPDCEVWAECNGW